MRRSLRTTALAAMLGLSASLSAFGAEATYVIDSGHTQPVYEVSHFGYSLQRGRFTGVTGKVTVDLEKKSGSIDVTIDTTSVSSGHPTLDEHLKGENYFNSAKFPTLTFKSTNVVFEGSRPAKAVGEITLLGVTKPLTLTITNFRCAPLPWKPKEERCGGDATATLVRSEFGMIKLVPGVSDEVRLLINLEATRPL